MNTLLLADLHLTSAPRDEYRWRIFPWLREACPKNGVKYLILLGDLTEQKDHHSSRLVNRLVDELCKLYREAGLLFIYVLPGNHDGVDLDCPYFRFLRQFPYIQYIETPYLQQLSGKEVLFLPHTKDPLGTWDSELLHKAEVIFMHQTVAGAKSESGHTLEGVSLAALHSAKRADIWSGDVHVPQCVGIVKYVGAPYPVRFGDVFQPRAVLLDHRLSNPQDLSPPSFARLMITVESPVEKKDFAEAKPGDQIKVKVRLTKAQYVDWEQIKHEVVAYCKEAKVDLCGLEVEKIEESRARVRLRGSTSIKALLPSQTLQVWCEKQNISEALALAGQQILSDALKEKHL